MGSPLMKLESLKEMNSHAEDTLVIPSVSARMTMEDEIKIVEQR